MRKTRILAIEVLLAVLLNVTAGLLQRPMAIGFAKLGWWILSLTITYFVVSDQTVWPRVIRIRAVVYRWAWNVGIIILILTTATIYWKLISVGCDRLFAELPNATPEQNASNGGFIQLEDKSFARGDSAEKTRIETGDVRVGEIIRIKFTLANRGTRPVSDNQSWGIIAIVKPELNPGYKLRKVLLRDLKTSYVKFNGSGNSLGIGLSEFNFAQSNPLTQDDVMDLKRGSRRLHLLLMGAWTDESGRCFYWTHAEWTNWPQVPLAMSFWKGS